MRAFGSHCSGAGTRSEQTREWFERSADEQFFFWRFAQITALLRVTNKETMGRDTKNIAVA